MPPLQSNATLTAVSSAGRREDPGSDTPDAAAGTPKFAGSVRVYYREKRERFSGPEGINNLVRRTVIVDTREPAIEWHEGDVVTFTRDRGGEVVARVQEAVAAELGPLAGTGVETTRVELEPK
jgi:hypothetical protein